MDENEEWRPVTGYEGLYEVSSLGRVRSLSREVVMIRKKRGVMLKAALSSAGYPTVSLYKDKKMRWASVHSVVLEAFVGPRPPAHDGAHGDGVRSNSTLSNLRWATKKENAEDKVAHGTRPVGPHGPARLKREQVLEIRRRALEDRKALRDEFGISKTHLGRILRGECWEDAK